MPLPNIDVPHYELILPSTGKKIKYRPYLVKEQKILLMSVMSDSVDEMLLSVKQIIKNCTFGTLDVDAIPQFDIEYIFLKLRCKSVGEIVEPVVTCKACSKDVKLHVDLNTIEVSKPEQSNKIELAPNIGVILKYPTLEEEARIATHGKDMPEEYALMYECVENIYDKDQVYTKKEFTLEEFIAFIENLPGSKFEKILAFFTNLPRVEAKVEVKCPCGHTTEFVLQGIKDFLA